MTLGQLGILVLQLSIILYPCLMTLVCTCMSNQHIFFFIFTHAQVVLKYVKQKDSKHNSYILFL